MKERIFSGILAAVVVLVFANLVLADGTINKPWREVFRVYDATGAGRNNCLAARYNAKSYRNRTAISQSWSFRNFSSDGNYSMRTYPATAGEYNVLLSYSGIFLTSFQKTIRAFDEDTNRARSDAAFANTSGLINKRPTNPLLATDARIPGTVIASSAEVAKASTALSNTMWTDARAVKLDNLDAATSTRAAASTAISNTTWTDARAAKLDNLDVASSTRAPASTALSNATWTDARAAKQDNLDATVSSRATLSDVLSAITTRLSDIAGSVWNYAFGRNVDSTNALGAQAKSDVRTEAATALNSYDPPTKVELDAGFNNFNSKADSVFAMMTTVRNQSAAVYHNMTTFAGTGDTSVTHDKGGSCNLCWKSSTGSGIADGVVIAYTKDDWAAGNRTDAYVRGWTKTGDGGQWVWPLYLNKGVTYMLVYTKSGFKTATVEVTP